MITDGVMVLSAAMMKLKAAGIAEGKTDRACRRVVYEAMIMGGNGGKSAASAGGGSGSTGFVGW